jgi:hypothetical protein
LIMSEVLKVFLALSLSFCCVRISDLTGSKWSSLLQI